MYNVMCSPLKHHSGSFHWSKNPPPELHLFIPHLLPQAPGNHWFCFFTFSTVLLFPECHLVGITEHVAFFRRLCSSDSMSLRFLNVFSWLGTSFLLLLNNIPLYSGATVWISIRHLEYHLVNSRLWQLWVKLL